MSDPTLIPQAALALLEAAVNHALRMDPYTFSQFEALEGRVVELRLQRPDLSIFMLPGRDGLRLMGHYAGEADTVLAGTPFSLLRLGAGTPGSGLFSGEVKIHGDVELGQRFRRILGGLDIDWEEHLSRLTGDVVAHQLGNLARGLRRWGEQAAGNLGLALAEYVQEERRDVPSRPEVEEFLAGVDVLRSDVDRLEARMQRLVRRLDGT